MYYHIRQYKWEKGNSHQAGFEMLLRYNIDKYSSHNIYLFIINCFSNNNINIVITLVKTYFYMLAMLSKYKGCTNVYRQDARTSIIMEKGPSIQPCIICYISSKKQNKIA